MSEIKRNKDAQSYEDSHAIDNIEYNAYAGGIKALGVGPALEYIGNAFAGLQVQAGDQLYLLNLSGAVGYIAMDTSAPAAPVAPGVNIFPVFNNNEFTIYAVAEKKFIRTSIATLHVYRLRDQSVVRVNP